MLANFMSTSAQSWHFHNARALLNSNDTKGMLHPKALSLNMGRVFPQLKKINWKLENICAFQEMDHRSRQRLAPDVRYCAYIQYLILCDGLRDRITRAGTREIEFKFKYNIFVRLLKICKVIYCVYFDQKCFTKNSLLSNTSTSLRIIFSKNRLKKTFISKTGNNPLNIFLIYICINVFFTNLFVPIIFSKTKRA